MTAVRRALAVMVAGLMALAGCSFSKSAQPAGSPLNLQTVDWDNAAVPGAVCGLPGSVVLHNGSATVQTNAFPSSPQVHVSEAGGTIYGPLEAPGSNTAGVSISCSNGGGTADAVLASGWAIFSGSGGDPHALGVIRPQHAPTPGVPLPYIGQINISAGTITAQESWYKDGDPTCCPTGSSTVIWRYTGGKLVTP